MFKKIKGRLVSVSHKRGAALMFGGAVAMASPMAFAASGGGLASQVLAKLGGVEADVTSILALLVGVLTLFVLYGLIRKAVGK